MKELRGSSFVNAGLSLPRLTALAGAAAVVLGLSGLATQPVAAQNSAQKVGVCHIDSEGAFNVLSIGANALQAHLAHGDGLPGAAVPGQPGYVFDAACNAIQVQPDFTAFYIRNNDSSIAPPWDTDMSIEENVEGDGFAAETPRGGQKVGYGTNFFDGVPLGSVQSANWDKVSGKPGVVSYLNIWVTDGTNYAIISSENDYRGTDFLTRTEWKVFETDITNLGWLCSTGPATRVNSYLLCNGSNATLADIPANITIMSPTSYPTPPVGTGAPRGGYGFNLIYGDTQANFVGNYHLENLSITVGGIVYFAQ